MSTCRTCPPSGYTSRRCDHHHSTFLDLFLDPVDRALGLDHGPADLRGRCSCYRSCFASRSISCAKKSSVRPTGSVLLPLRMISSNWGDVAGHPRNLLADVRSLGEHRHLPDQKASRPSFSSALASSSSIRERSRSWYSWITSGARSPILLHPIHDQPEVLEQVFGQRPGPP